MNIIDRRRDPGGKTLREPPALHPPRPRARAARRARGLAPSARSRTSEKGGEIVVPAGGVHEPHPAPRRRRRHARIRAAGQQEVHRRRHHPAPRRGRGRRQARQRTAKARTISASPCRTRNFSTSSSKTSNCPIWPSARSMGVEESAARAAPAIARPARRRRSRSRAPCAIRCRAASRSGGRSRKMSPRSKRRSRSSTTKAATTRKSRSSAKTSRRVTRKMKLIPYIDPFDVRYPPLRAGPAPDRAGGDVLPDGRLRLDGRAHEGPRQAVLLAALSLPEAPLQARRRRLHPPHARSEGGRRGDLLPLAARPAARSSRPRSRRWPASSRTAIRVNQWNIYAAQASDGDNLPIDNANTVALLQDGDPAALPVLRLSRSRPRRRTTSGGEASLALARLRAGGGADERMAMRKVRHRRDIYPVFRELFARDGAKAEAEP